MKIKIVIKLIIILVIVAGVAGAGYYYLLLPQLNKGKLGKAEPDHLFGWKYPVAAFPDVGPSFPLTGAVEKLLAYSSIRDPGGIPKGLPIRLKIPSIGVDSAIEDAYITSDGRMDVPAGTVNVAWFALGPYPGREGSAVIGGHYGRYEENKGPTVFFSLDKLQAGDKVYIEDDSGNTLAFRVREIKSFDRNADATSVFTSNDGLAHLNLITCEGVWNQVNDSYPDRRVVFTDAIPAENTVVVNNPPVVTVALNKLPPAGAEPTAATNPTQIPTVAPTEVPTETVATPDSTNISPSSTQIVVETAKNLYATPTDGVITSSLLISIVFIAFKIIGF